MQSVKSKTPKIFGTCLFLGIFIGLVFFFNQRILEDVTDATRIYEPAAARVKFQVTQRHSEKVKSLETLTTASQQPVAEKRKTSSQRAMPEPTGAVFETPLTDEILPQ
jgi:hypothetical protein